MKVEWNNNNSQDTKKYHTDNKDNTLQQNYPTLPEAIFEIPDSPKEQKPGRKQHVLTDVHKQSDQVKGTETNHEEGSTLEKDPGDNFKTEQTSNHDDSADDGSEESIVVSE